MGVDDGHPPLLESWYRELLEAASFDISSSGVQPYTFAEVRERLGLAQSELDAVVLQDSVSFGAPSLRQAIANRYAGGRIERVMATHGSSEAIALVLSVLLEPGDRVVLCGPIYHSFESFAALRRCRVVNLPAALLGDDAQFACAVDEHVISGTKAVIVNIPHNPTGGTIAGETFQHLAERVSAVGSVLVWDAALAELPMNGASAPAHISLQDNVITIGTLSKAFGMPGLRVGWYIATPDLLARTLEIRDRTTLFLSPLIEMIAAGVITHAEAFIEPRLRQACGNLAYVDSWIRQHADRLMWRRPCGGVCGLVEVLGVPQTEPFCRALLAATGVLLVPGAAFSAPGAVRLGYGGSAAELREGLNRLSEFLRHN
jgi:capreomycidine synthase